MQQDSEGLNFEQTLGGLRRRAPLILLCVVLAAGAAFGLSKRQTKEYMATASLAINNNPLSQQISALSTGSTGSSGNSSSLAQQDSDLELVRLGDLAAKTASSLDHAKMSSSLDHGLTGAKVSESLSVNGQGESGVIDVSANMTSPTLAADVANTYARLFAEEQQSATSKDLKSALTLVKKQLAALSRAQRVGADGLNLQNRLQTLTLLAGLKYGNVRVAQEALAPTSPTSPKTSRNTTLGALLGLLIGLGLAFMLERLDRRIKGPEDLETIYRLPMLGVVPESKRIARSVRHDGERTALSPSDAEAFNLIRAHLRFFNIDRDLRTVLVASPMPGDGKTTIARHLAEAAARMDSRVLLLEVDLRHPTLAQRLALQGGPGLADVLIGTVPMDEATESVEVQAPSGGGITGRTLDVLAAGAFLPPNPAALLEGRAMDAVLERARSSYDLVVIDTPPLTAVSDAFPLLTKVDGVVIVGWVGRSRRDAAERLHKVLATSGAPLLGIVANGSKFGGQGSYASPREDKSSPPSAASTNGSAAGTSERLPTAKA